MVALTLLFTHEEQEGASQGTAKGPWTVAAPITHLFCLTVADVRLGESITPLVNVASWRGNGPWPFGFPILP